MSGISNTQSNFYIENGVFSAGKGTRKKEKDGESIKDIIERIGDIGEADTEEKMEFIRLRKREIMEKVKRGETEPSFPIGAASYTMKQWNKIMRSVDKAIDDMQERIHEDEEKYGQKTEKKRSIAVTDDVLSELLGTDTREEESLI